MSGYDQIKQEMLQDFGEAYRGFGLSKLMGRVIALLLFMREPISLDEIAEHLEMSKGPISQITRRLRDRNLIRKIWKPGSRKDFYEIAPDVFGSAFRNYYELIRHNTMIANRLSETVQGEKNADLEHLSERLDEMEQFYTLMEKHLKNFMEDWAKERSKKTE